mgnify:FL=1|jgi:hypothetical protein
MIFIFQDASSSNLGKGTPRIQRIKKQAGYPACFKKDALSFLFIGFLAFQFLSLKLPTPGEVISDLLVVHLFHPHAFSLF